LRWTSPAYQNFTIAVFLGLSVLMLLMGVVTVRSMRMCWVADGVVVLMVIAIAFATRESRAEKIAKRGLDLTRRLIDLNDQMIDATKQIENIENQKKALESQIEALRAKW
jgi:sensor histidine kinase YesM